MNNRVFSRDISNILACAIPAVEILIAGFHTSETMQQRAFYVLKTADLYKKVDEKVAIKL